MHDTKRQMIAVLTACAFLLAVPGTASAEQNGLSSPVTDRQQDGQPPSPQPPPCDPAKSPDGKCPPPAPPPPKADKDGAVGSGPASVEGPDGQTAPPPPPPGAPPVPPHENPGNTDGGAVNK